MSLCWVAQLGSVTDGDGCLMATERAFPGFPVNGRHPCVYDPVLSQAARHLLHNSLAPASWRAYRGGGEAFLRFCEHHGLAALPADPDTVVFFLASLKQTGVAAGTARQRLAAVGHLHRRWGLDFTAGRHPFVRAAVRGFPARGVAGARPPRRGITVDHLRVLKNSLGDSGMSYFSQRSIWAACCVGFYGGLRASDYLRTAPGRGLNRSDIRFAADGTSCACRLRVQKTRQSGPPEVIHLPATGTSTCPVRALRLYCGQRDGRASEADALFITDDGAPLSRRTLSDVLRRRFGSGFSTHSLRIGIATEAARVGVTESTIQRLGRWRSSAYLGYVRGARFSVSQALRAVARGRAPAGAINS